MSGNNNNITAIVIVKNQEQAVRSSLPQLRWVDEILVVDNESTDATAKVARQLGATVITEKGMDFAKLRNRGAETAAGDWLLYLDTDEELTTALRQEITAIVRQFNPRKDPHAYVLPRENYYLGKKWPYQDGMIRLIYKPSLIGWEGQLHETAKIRGVVGRLAHPVIHRTHTTLSAMVEKTNEWSEIEADLRLAHNHPPVVPWRLLRVFLTAVYTSYVRQQGWKAGTHGVIESMYQGFSVCITYIKLWERQQNYA